MTVLDVGCGWGGLGLGLHERYGVNVTGISLSEEQLKVANRRAQEQSVVRAGNGAATPSMG